MKYYWTQLETLLGHGQQFFMIYQLHESEIQKLKQTIEQDMPRY